MIRTALPLLAGLLAAVLPSTTPLHALDLRSAFPDTGSAAIRLRAQDASSGLRVLMLSLRPGDEDLATVAWLRASGGARVISAYVTNGESGPTDAGTDLPGDVAALRRNGTFAALTALEADVNFLNFPDPGRVADRKEAAAVWDLDSLGRKLAGVVQTLRPHIILLSRDRDAGMSSVLHQLLRDEVLRLVAPAPTRKTALPGVTMGGPRWRVQRVWLEQEGGRGLRVPTDREVAILGTTPIGFARALATRHCAGGWRQPVPDRPGVFTLVFPSGGTKANGLTDGVDLKPPASIARVQKVVLAFAAEVKKGNRPRKALQERMVAVMDSVDLAISSEPDRAGAAMAALIDMKGALELLRSALLGVTVRYTISEEILTDRQLTAVQIDTVTGRDDGGSTDLYFPATERGWILNEGPRSRIPLAMPGEYRLITPEKVTYDMPWAQYSLDHAVPVRPVMLFLLHRGRTRAGNFVHRVPLYLRYAPKFTLEVLTPIVRVVAGEHLVVRLTNHSRDGIRDAVVVEDSLVTGQPSVFRLTGKEQSVVDTLPLHWNRVPAGGAALVPVLIGTTPVAQFLARHFDVAADTARQVVLLTGYNPGPTADALRRLGWDAVRTVRSAAELGEAGGAMDVLIVDAQAQRMLGEAMPEGAVLERFAKSGVHVVFLPQEDDGWNAQPLWNGMRLQNDPTLSATLPVVLDTMHAFMHAPNPVGAEAYGDWIFARGEAAITPPSNPSLEVPVRTGSGTPLVLTAITGKGRMTYVNLALGPQLMSIHPGAFRILANIVSTGGTRDEARR